MARVPNTLSWLSCRLIASAAGLTFVVALLTSHTAVIKAASQAAPKKSAKKPAAGAKSASGADESSETPSANSEKGASARSKAAPKATDGTYLDDLKEVK